MRRSWSWPLTVIGALVVLGFVLYGGQDGSAPPTDEEPSAGFEEITFPMPEPEPAVPPAEQARGIYALTGPTMSIVLDLQEGRRFVFTSVAPGFGRRAGRGTWSLAGDSLSLAYTAITDKPEITAEAPYVVVNKWYGRSIELLETGRPERVILQKRAAIRNR